MGRGGHPHLRRLRRGPGEGHPPLTPPSLLVITGPIAAGKSTIAEGIAESIADAGRSVVTTDLDDVAMAIKAPNDHWTTTWERGRRAHGALVGAWLRSGIEVVIVHGPFFSDDDRGALLAEVPAEVTPRWLQLRVSVDVALERVDADPTRGLSRHPPFLRWTHEEFHKVLPDIPAGEWTFDTARTDAAEIVATVSAALLSTS